MEYSQEVLESELGHTGIIFDPERDTYIIPGEKLEALIELIDSGIDLASLEGATKCCYFGPRQPDGSYKHQVTVKAPNSLLADIKCTIKAKGCGYNSGGASGGKCSQEKPC